MIKLVPRGEVSKFWVYGSPLLAILLTLVTGGLLFYAMGLDPIETLRKFLIDPIATPFGLAELGVKATPLVLIAIGLSIGFKAGVWNIGAEGQLLLGAIVGGAVALAFYEVPGYHILPLVLIAGFIGGALWGAIPAFLRTQLNTNEILTSLMLVYIATLLLSYMVHGPLRNPDGFNFPESRLFHEWARLPILVEFTRFHAGTLIALLAVFIGWLFMSKHIIGLQIRVAGQAPKAARFAGYSQKKLIWLAFLVSGGLAGLAGIIEITGTMGQLRPSISPGYGFTAIIVAFVGRLHPVGILFAGVILALTFLGGEAVQMTAGLPQAITGVFQGMLLFYLLAADVFIHYRVQIGSRSATPLKKGTSHG